MDMKTSIEKRAQLLTMIVTSEKELLTPADVAPVLGCDPQDIRVTAKQAPERLGFPVTVIGTRVKIPRRAFLVWLGHGEVSE